jgi:hypothetical protein
LATCWHTSLAGKNLYALAPMFLHVFWPKLMAGAWILGHGYSYLRAYSSEGKKDTYILKEGILKVIHSCMYYSEPFSLNRCCLDITHDSTIPDCTSCLLWPEHPDIIVPDFFLECQFKMSKILSSTYKTQPYLPYQTNSKPTKRSPVSKIKTTLDSGYPSQFTLTLSCYLRFLLHLKVENSALNKFVGIGASYSSCYQWVNDLCLPLLGA